jgi:hypothetical protein
MKPLTAIAGISGSTPFVASLSDLLKLWHVDQRRWSA